jgi:Predicted flavoprotein involved in K+ transport
MIYDIIIIGFGISGISLAKESIKRNKKILIIEKNSSFGGIWFNCNNNTSLQTHKDYYEFNNEISMDSKFDSYPSKKEILIYLETIINKYQLDKHVKYNYIVNNIKKKGNNYLINNKYEAKYIGICSGHNNIPIKIKELDSFRGIIIHSSNLKNFDFSGIKNKNICVLGNGASACDVIKNIQ